jgi:hypothetical protein
VTKGKSSYLLSGIQEDTSTEARAIDNVMGRQRRQAMMRKRIYARGEGNKMAQEIFDGLIERRCRSRMSLTTMNTWCCTLMMRSLSVKMRSEYYAMNLDDTFTLKEESIGPPKMYLGGPVRKVNFDNGVQC